jgi:nucleotide-binding universal stress UspA family protein
MKKNRVVFFAHDFSVASKNALNVAADIAQTSNAKLFIYHVVSTSIITDAQAAYTASPELDIKKANALMRRGVTYLKKKYPNVKIAFEVNFGFLIPSLKDKIEDVNPMLCVYGVKKRTGLDKVVFGDVCTSMIGKTNSPMLVVPINYKRLKLKSIVYAWDGQTSEVSQLAVLREMTGNLSSDLLALNVSHYDEHVIKNSSTFKSALKRAFPNSYTDTVLIQGLNQELEFEKAVKKIKPDLLVVYAHHYTLWQSLFHKRFSKQAIKFSQSPVLVVMQ